MPKITGKILALNTFTVLPIKVFTNMGSSGIWIEFTDGTELELQADYDYKKEYAILIVSEN